MSVKDRVATYRESWHDKLAEKNNLSKANPSTKQSHSDYVYMYRHINRDSNGRLIKDIV